MVVVMRPGTRQEDIAALAPAESWDGELLQQIEAHKGKEQTP